MIDLLIPLLPGWDEQPTLSEQLASRPKWEKPLLVPLPPPDAAPTPPPPPPVADQIAGGLPVPPVPKDGSRASFLAVASSQVGWMEQAGNVGNPWGAWDGVPNEAYCGQGLSWALEASGVPGEWRGAGSQRYVPAAFWYWAAIGRIVSVDQVQPGDLLMYDWQGDGELDHIEVAVGLEFIGNGVVSVVGYNTGTPEGVHWTTRGLWQITAVARPSFTDAL